jgi:hypothetical protein
MMKEEGPWCPSAVTRAINARRVIGMIGSVGLLDHMGSVVSDFRIYSRRVPFSPSAAQVRAEDIAVPPVNLVAFIEDI